MSMRKAKSFNHKSSSRNLTSFPFSVAKTSISSMRDQNLANVRYATEPENLTEIDDVPILCIHFYEKLLKLTVVEASYSYEVDG